MNLQSLSKTSKIWVSVWIGIIFILGFYLAAYKSFGYQSQNGTFGISIMILAFVAILIIWLNEPMLSKLKIPTGGKIFLIIGVAMSVVIALFFLTDYVRQNLLNNELNKNGIETTAVITGFEFESIKSNQIEYATIQYEFENQIIIQRFRNFNHEYNFNQTLPIRISTKKPFMFELIETKKY